MRTLDAGQLRAALPMPLCIEAMEPAFRGDCETPQRAMLGVSAFMPGRVGSYTGVKVVSTVPGDPAGLVAVFGPDGHPLGLVDGPTLTAIRTAAGAGLATRLLGREDARVMAMLGAGAMAYDQVEAVRAVRDLDRVLVWSRTRERAEQLAARVDGEVVDDPDDAVAQADVVTAATPATEPLMRAESVRPGTHLNAIGAFTPEMAELPPQVLSRDVLVVVDDVGAAAVEAGDLIRAGRKPDGVLGEVLSGRLGRADDQALTVFKSVGIASQDITAAVAALTGKVDHAGFGAAPER